MEFSYPRDTIIDDSAKELKYSSHAPKPSPEQTSKRGQLKLFVSELQFITSYWVPSEIPNLTVLYIGAGPGHHTITLAKMFPTIKWELYDIQDFASGLESLSNVTLFPKYFETSDIARYANRDDVFLICDIRNLAYSQGGKTKWTWYNEKKVLDDMRLQESWVRDVKPIWSSLKFRLPYDEPEVFTRLGKTWDYLDGIVYVQPWVGPTSSEARLIVSRDNLTSRPWDYAKFNRQMFYHNTVTRLQQWKSKYIVDYDSSSSGERRPTGTVGRSFGRSTATDRFVLNDYFDSVMSMEVMASYMRRMYGTVPMTKFPAAIVKTLVPIANVEGVDEE